MKYAWQYVRLALITNLMLNLVVPVQAQSVTPEPTTIQSRLTVAEFLSGTVKGIESHCQAQAKARADEIKKLLAHGKTAEADFLKEHEEVLCVCSPQKYKALQSSLSEVELSEVVSKSQANQKIVLPVSGYCMRPMIRRQFYNIEACTSAAIKSKNTTATCKCLVAQTDQLLNQLSDSEVAQLGLDAAKYLPIAAEAKKQGLAKPKTPILLETFLSKAERCKRQ
jgi:hypothetical protein